MAGILSISISLLGEVISTLFLVRVVMSWFIRPGTYNRVMDFVVSATEPFVAPVRRIIFKFSKGQTMFDFSFLIAWLLVDYLIVPTLIKLVNYIFI